jgi:hypothetical protein
MVLRVDYYTLLSRAVESLERDAYAARGAIYDREHKALLKRLISSNEPCTDADIMREEQAFRDAVRRIEFPDEMMQAAPRTPQREPVVEASWPATSREKARAQRRESLPEPANDPSGPKRPGGSRWDAAHADNGRRPSGRQSETADGEDETGWPAEPQKSRSLLKLALAYVLVAGIVVGAGAVGYAYVVGAIDLTGLTSGLTSWLPSWPGTAAAPPSQRAILTEGGQAGRTGTPVEGKAVWRTRMEPGGASGKADMVVTLDAEIPQQHIALNLTLSRVGDAGAGMSHLLELHFAKPEELPFGGIARITNIAMKGAETEAGESLVGTSINIAPGQFMFGLLGVEDVVRANVQRLRTQSWLGLTLVFGSGATYTLSIEKGAGGERAFNEAFAKWGQ